MLRFKFYVIVVLMILSQSSFSNNYHHATISFKVSGGDCKECRKIILKSVRKLSGVESVVWEYKKQRITIIYDSMMISNKKIKQAIANSGHDTDEIKATDEAYNLLPECCKYKKI